MILIFLAVVQMSFANVDGLLAAKYPAQVQRWQHQEEELSILKQRCEAEVRGVFFPANCFLWERKASLGSHDKKFFAEWFDRVCVKALRQDAMQVRFHLKTMDGLQGACRVQAEKSAEDWLYKAQREEGTEVFRLLPKVGRKFVLESGHETLAAQKTHRPQTARTPRRGLN